MSNLYDRGRHNDGLTGLFANMRFDLIWFVPLCAAILFYFIVPNITSAYHNILLMFDRFTWGIFVSPSAYVFISAIVGSVGLPVVLLLLVPIFFNQDASGYKRRYLLSLGVAIDIVLSSLLLQVIIWGSFPLPVDKEGYIHLRLIPFFPWPETPLLGEAGLKEFA